MELYGLPARLIAELTGVSLKTATRWKRQGSMPAIAAELMQIKDRKDLGSIDRDWYGFRLIKGELWTPESDRVSPGEVRSIAYRRQQLKELERELREPRQLILV